MSLEPLEDWQREAARIGGAALVAVMAEIRDNQRRMIDTIGEIDKKVGANADNIKNIMGAFPGLDYVAHRVFHEAIIRNTDEKRRLRMAIQEKTIAGAIWFGITSVCLWLYEHKGMIWEMFSK